MGKTNFTLRMGRGRAHDKHWHWQQKGGKQQQQLAGRCKEASAPDI
jgi:hypothetical protein